MDARLYREALELLQGLRQQFGDIGVSKSQLGGLLRAADWAQVPEELGKYVRHKKELAMRRSQSDESAGTRTRPGSSGGRGTAVGPVVEFWTRVEARLQKMRQEGKEVAFLVEEGSLTDFGPSGSSVDQVQLWLYRRYLQHLAAELLETAQSGR